MSRRHLIAPSVLLLAAACALTNRTAPVTNDRIDTDAAPPADWHATMQRVGRDFKVIEKALLSRPIGDLRAVAAAAGNAAALLRTGYGNLEDRRIPEFAQLARQAESWLLRIELEARQDHGDLAVEQFRTGEPRHCNKCHEAAKPFFAW